MKTFALLPKYCEDTKRWRWLRYVYAHTPAFTLSYGWNGEEYYCEEKK